MPKNLKIIAILFCVVSIIGLIDATYLTYNHYRGGIPPCTIHGCEVVLTSSYSEIVGVPLALFGVMYYIVILILSLASLQSKNTVFIRNASRFTVVGFLASAYFVYLQLFVIHAICIYCMASATSSTILFILGVYTLATLGGSAPTQQEVKK